MKRFAELLDRLAYEPGRNNKLRLMTDYFRSTPDPELSARKAERDTRAHRGAGRSHVV
jgi:hypothetical protein